MHLLRARFAGVGPFESVLLPFADAEGRPRRMTVIHGSGGVGKTMILAAIAATRPGHAVALTPTTLGTVALEGSAREAPSEAVLDWWLGQDDLERPHPLRVGTPQARLAPGEDEERFRRREQALFDKRAALGGFAFLAIPQNRWFSRQPIGISAPARTVARYDVRGAASIDEATRADLTRETKQSLAYAEIGAALTRSGPGRGMDLFGNAMRHAVGELLALAGFAYRGLDVTSFEPVFVDVAGRARPFDALPTRARHLVSFAALTVRLLWAAYPGRDPLRTEAVVAIDEVDLHQDAATQSGLSRALTSALPDVQWILTTTSKLVAASVAPGEVLALRRLPEMDGVELFVGEQALTH